MPSEADWFLKFVVRDWLTDPKLSLCRESTRGIWIDAICHMLLLGGSGRLDGTVVDLARLCRCTPNAMRSALDDLNSRGAADVTECHENVTLVNRRMSREYKSRVNARHRKRKERYGLSVTPVVTGMSHSMSHPISKSKSKSKTTPLSPPASGGAKKRRRMSKNEQRVADCHAAADSVPDLHARKEVANAGA